ncbi:pentapeptide repeat-containing protein [Synechococcus sp. MU1644]|nr:pentapeptide repeat-containing protein [Synechococcus sp. MU1644]
MLRVERAETTNFVSLVDAAGLEPESDFRGVDLRRTDLRGSDLTGFDFRKSDLRGAVIDKKTILPPVDKLLGAKIDFDIQDEKEPIVSVMARIQSANAGQRHSLLSTLVNQYDSNRHTDQFLFSLLDRSRTISAASEIVPFFSIFVDDQLEGRILARIGNILDKARSKSPPRRKIAAKSPMTGAMRLIENLRHSTLERGARFAEEYQKNSLDMPALIQKLLTLG